MAAAQVLLSNLYLASGDRTAAEARANDARRTAPEVPDVRLALARSLLAQGKVGPAEAEITALLAQAPDAPAAHALHGVALMAMRDSRRSAGCLQSSARKGSSSARGSGRVDRPRRQHREYRRGDRSYREPDRQASERSVFAFHRRHCVQRSRPTRQARENVSRRSRARSVEHGCLRRSGPALHVDWKARRGAEAIRGGCAPAESSRCRDHGGHHPRHARQTRRGSAALRSHCRRQPARGGRGKQSCLHARRAGRKPPSSRSSMRRPRNHSCRRTLP